MFNIKTGLVLTLAAVVATSMPAWAESKGLKRKHERRQVEMNALDENGDGVLQFSELKKKAEKDFKAADTDKDKILSEAEMEAVFVGFDAVYSSEYFAERHARSLAHRYNNADKNDDNVLSWAEYKHYFARRHAEFDRDHDGIITPKEYRMDQERTPKRYRPKD